MQAPLVAILNTSQAVIELLRDICEDGGMRVVTGYVDDFKHGERDIEQFLAEHQPKVIIYDIAIPYEENWQYFTAVRTRSRLPDCAFVVTTTNRNVLEELVGLTDSIGLVGKPFDLSLIVAAVWKALQECG